MNEKIRFGEAVKTLCARIEKEANNSLKGDGLTLMQMAVLQECRKRENYEMSMKELERHFSISQPTIAGIVSRLEEKGLVLGHTSPSDRRVKLVRLTEKGILSCDSAEKYIKASEDTLIKGFTEEEKRLFISFLMRASENLR